MNLVNLMNIQKSVKFFGLMKTVKFACEITELFANIYNLEWSSSVKSTATFSSMKNEHDENSGNFAKFWVFIKFIMKIVKIDYFKIIFIKFTQWKQWKQWKSEFFDGFVRKITPNQGLGGYQTYQQQFPAATAFPPLIRERFIFCARMSVESGVNVDAQATKREIHVQEPSISAKRGSISTPIMWH